MELKLYDALVEQKQIPGSNRTFMELKWRRWGVPHLVGVVLIAPLWN